MRRNQLFRFPSAYLNVILAGHTRLKVDTDMSESEWLQVKSDSSKSRGGI